MLDPFLDFSTSKLDRKSDYINEEWAAQRYGHPIKDANMPGQLAWWIGNLMIRVGKKLIKESLPTSSAKRTV